MRKFNIVYDCIFSDVDIIAAPDCIAESIVALSQRYEREEASKTHVLDTDGLIQWLNDVILPPLTDERATVVKRHTYFDPELHPFIPF